MRRLYRITGTFDYEAYFASLATRAHRAKPAVIEALRKEALGKGFAPEVIDPLLEKWGRRA